MKNKQAHMKSNLSTRIRISGTFLVKFILILNTIASLAQHAKKEYTMEQLKSKQKQELIQIALEILKEKQPSLVIDFECFEVRVFFSSLDILVEWKRKVTFIPLEKRFKGIYQYDTTVSLMTNCISKSHYSDLKNNDSFEQNSLFSLTKNDEKVIEMAKQVYNESSEKGQIYVVEKENDYEMIHMTESFRSSQLIERDIRERIVNS